MLQVNPKKICKIIKKKLILTRNEPNLSEKIVKYLLKQCETCKNDTWEENFDYCDICETKRCRKCLQKCQRCGLIACKDTCSERFCGICITFLDCYEINDLEMQKKVYKKWKDDQ